MSKTQVNGVNGTNTAVYSSTIDHFTSYPLITELLNYYKSLPLGAKSIELSQNLYNSLGAPVLSHPLVQQPYAYISPYAAKIDELGDNTLNRVDASFPAIKETNYQSLREHAGNAALYPFQLAGQGREYVWQTYSEECKKAHGQGLMKTGKAIVGTEFRIAGDVLTKVKEFVGPAKKDLEGTVEGAKKDAQGLKRDAEGKAEKVKKDAKAKKDEVVG